MNTYGLNTNTTQTGKKMVSLSVICIKMIVCCILSIVVSIVVFQQTGNSHYAAMGALFGFAMAICIGANDVANNLSASIGAGAINIKVVLMIAVGFEFSGAMIAGGDVTSTIKSGIIDPTM